MGFFCLSAKPWICIRQLESHETMYSALVSNAEVHFTSPIAVEMAGNLAEKVPPKPQQVSAAFISINSKPWTLANNSRGGRLLFNSRKPWQPSWNVTLCGNFAPRSVTPSLLTKKLENSQHFGASSRAACSCFVPANSSG